MSKLQNAIMLLFVLITGALSYENITMGQLPPDIAEQLKEMYTNALLVLQPNCTQPQEPEVSFLLYTRNNPDEPVLLDRTNPTQIDPKKKILLVIHGWLSSPTSPGILHLKNKYLERYDCNVIVVDWFKSAWQLYTVSYCDVPNIGQSIANFLCVLSELLTVPLTEIHVIGHSMGGQIAGYLGQYVGSECKQQIGRITGLDPAGFIFKKNPESERLDKKDAKLVDVIHTDGWKFGYWLRCGTVDFHPNCRDDQPGCPFVRKVDNSTLVSDLFCSLHRSLEYMAESVTSEDFIAVSCGLCPRNCEPDIITEVYTVMGEECKTVPKGSQNYFLPTGDSPPYALGWDPYEKCLDKY